MATAFPGLQRPKPVPRASTVPSILDHLRAFRRPISVKELAPILGHSEDALYRMTHEGKIPRLIIPGSDTIKFDPGTIAFWLCSHNPILNQVAKAS